MVFTLTRVPLFKYAKSRILCLHGMGTSAEIFRIQTGAIREQLDSMCEFTFLEAPLICDPAEGIRDFFVGPYRTFYSAPPSREELMDAHSYVLQFIEEEGPFDGVMGFSQGAALAAAILIRDHEHHPYPMFKFAIFFCGTRPWNIETGDRYEAMGKKASTPGHGLIHIPTCHIVGRKDQWYEESLGLLSLCDGMTVCFDHRKGHTLPMSLQETKPIVKSILEIITWSQMAM
ncbi:hypothetical protein K493DRAFT_306994 [Basidiobolus meristosporus CBS 931.73]|uniref:Serine hydrolase domain-containing protein n=1 Tax=Basidiobolus meristosporus CBS 931.73 TaxID=1314790 RepID=A0A1Y1XM96_9FUNG|nr:hypothetical protein K493DRAFT_306994 [Basidiobolus meristosporus CBS 931.73]|eukprot:ORX86867.1 hypothetical protein K493DRAFT_306994 [Basidiobolus meristosporus CBS 931.73]